VRLRCARTCSEPLGAAADAAASMFVQGNLRGFYFSVSITTRTHFVEV
jgi:hypothetical protein